MNRAYRCVYDCGGSSSFGQIIGEHGMTAPPPAEATVTPPGQRQLWIEHTAASTTTAVALLMVKLWGSAA